LRFCWCGAPSLTRSLVCSFQFLPGIASAAFLRSESHGIHEHGLLSIFWDSPNMEGQVPVVISPRNRVAQLYHRALELELELEFVLRPMDSRPVRPWYRAALRPMTRHYLSLLFSRLTIPFFLFLGRPPWREGWHFTLSLVMKSRDDPNRKHRFSTDFLLFLRQPHVAENVLSPVVWRADHSNGSLLASQFVSWANMLRYLESLKR
jgi:hypothetical protein